MPTTWQNLLAGKPGITRLTRFDPSALPSQMAGEAHDFDPLRVLDAKEARHTDRFIQLAVAAADEALQDARLSISAANALRVGVCIGTAFGGVQAIETAYERFHAGGYKKVSPYFIPMLLGNMAAGHIAIRHGIRGVNLNHSTACTSGTHAIGEALLHLRSGRAEAMVAGGSEAPLTPVCIAGFCALRALSQRNDNPQGASRPFDRKRDGFVMAEGSGVLILEELEHARRRGAPMYAELLGYGASADAYHLTQPDPEAAGPAAAMQLALADAGLEPSAVSHINAHGTSTPYNDRNETLALKQVFGPHAASLTVTANKSMLGHSLGAAGAVEAVITVLSLRHQVLPPTINYEEPDPDCDLDYVPNEARAARFETALTNSYGFGGTNGSLLFRRVERTAR